MGGLGGGGRGEGLVSGVGEPGSGSASLAFFGEGKPSVQLIRSASEDVFESAKRPSAVNGDLQSVGLVGIGEGVDEELHVVVAVVRAFAVDQQPPIGVVVFLWCPWHLARIVV